MRFCLVYRQYSALFVLGRKWNEHLRLRGEAEEEEAVETELGVGVRERIWASNTKMSARRQPRERDLSRLLLVFKNSTGKICASSFELNFGWISFTKDVLKSSFYALCSYVLGFLTLPKYGKLYFAEVRPKMYTPSLQ